MHNGGKVSVEVNGIVITTDVLHAVLDEGLIENSLHSVLVLDQDRGEVDLLGLVEPDGLAGVNSVSVHVFSLRMYLMVFCFYEHTTGDK